MVDFCKMAPGAHLHRSLEETYERQVAEIHEFVEGSIFALIGNFRETLCEIDNATRIALGKADNATSEDLNQKIDDGWMEALLLVSRREDATCSLIAELLGLEDARMRKARVALQNFAREVINLGEKHESEVERDLAEKISQLNLVTLQNRRLYAMIRMHMETNNQEFQTKVTGANLKKELLWRQKYQMRLRRDCMLALKSATLWNPQEESLLLQDLWDLLKEFWKDIQKVVTDIVETVSTGLVVSGPVTKGAQYSQSIQRLHSGIKVNVSAITSQLSESMRVRHAKTYALVEDFSKKLQSSQSIAGIDAQKVFLSRALQKWTGCSKCTNEGPKCVMCRLGSLLAFKTYYNTQGVDISTMQTEGASMLEYSMLYMVSMAEKEANWLRCIDGDVVLENHEFCQNNTATLNRSFAKTEDLETVSEIVDIKGKLDHHAHSSTLLSTIIKGQHLLSEYDKLKFLNLHNKLPSSYAEVVRCLVDKDDSHLSVLAGKVQDFEDHFFSLGNSVAQLYEIVETALGRYSAAVVHANEKFTTTLWETENEFHIVKEKLEEDLKEAARQTRVSSEKECLIKNASASQEILESIERHYRAYESIISACVKGYAENYRKTIETYKEQLVRNLWTHFGLDEQVLESGNIMSDEHHSGESPANTLEDTGPASSDSTYSMKSRTFNAETLLSKIDKDHGLKEPITEGMPLFEEKKLADEFVARAIKAISQQIHEFFRKEEASMQQGIEKAAMEQRRLASQKIERLLREHWPKKMSLAAFYESQRERELRKHRANFQLQMQEWQGRAEHVLNRFERELRHRKQVIDSFEGDSEFRSAQVRLHEKAENMAILHQQIRKSFETFKSRLEKQSANYAKELREECQGILLAVDEYFKCLTGKQFQEVIVWNLDSPPAVVGEFSEEEIHLYSKLVARIRENVTFNEKRLLDEEARLMNRLNDISSQVETSLEQVKSRQQVLSVQEAKCKDATRARANLNNRLRSLIDQFEVRNKALEVVVQRIVKMVSSSTAADPMQTSDLVLVEIYGAWSMILEIAVSMGIVNDVVLKDLGSKLYEEAIRTLQDSDLEVVAPDASKLPSISNEKRMAEIAFRESTRGVCAGLETLAESQLPTAYEEILHQTFEKFDNKLAIQRANFLHIVGLAHEELVQVPSILISACSTGLMDQLTVVDAEHITRLRHSVDRFATERQAYRDLLKARLTLSSEQNTLQLLCQRDAERHEMVEETVSELRNDIFRMLGAILHKLMIGFPILWTRLSYILWAHDQFASQLVTELQLDLREQGERTSFRARFFDLKRTQIPSRDQSRSSTLSIEDLVQRELLSRHPRLRAYTGSLVKESGVNQETPSQNLYLDNATTTSSKQVRHIGSKLCNKLVSEIAAMLDKVVSLESQAESDESNWCCAWKKMIDSLLLG